MRTQTALGSATNSLSTSGRSFASEPARSPDGTQIVCRLFLAGTGEHLYTVRPTGSRASMSSSWLAWPVGSSFGS